MFTGIIEKSGEVTNLQQRAEILTLTITVKDFTHDLALGSSVAVDGACLTLTNKTPDSFDVDVINETISKTVISGYRVGRRVNLEKALSVSDRLDGHIVQGHVDCVGTLKSIKKSGDNVVYAFSVPEEQSDAIVTKGSIAIDGVSLTVAAISGSEFTVALIPTSLAITTFSERKVGDHVNVETDILGKYIQKLLLKQEKGIKPHLYS